MGVAAGVLAAAAPSNALASPSVKPKGMSEKAFRAFETKALGPRHASEHAARRALMRSKKGRAAIKRQAAAKAPARARRANAVDGAWESPFNLKVHAISSVVLHTGKVLMWAYPFGPGQARSLPENRNYAVAYLWDPSKGRGEASFKEVPLPSVDPDGGGPKPSRPANIWCSGQNLMSDGRVLVTGGNLEYEAGTNYYRGLNLTFTFDPVSETWQQHESMRRGRWYPTQTLLPDGRTLISSGIVETGDYYNNPDIEIFDPSKPQGQEISLLGVRGEGGTPPNGEPYPHQFLMPSGNLLMVGPRFDDSWMFTNPGNSMSWRDLPGEDVDRYAGSAVLLGDRVLATGGGYDASPAASSSYHTESGHSAGPSLRVGRSHLNTVLLPDRSMVTVGGGLGNGPNAGQWEAAASQKAIEIFDPASGQWRLGPAQQEARTYHSTAVMLPDGSVLSAGDDVNGGFNADTGEIYKPSYFFKARPTITAAPAGALAGDTFAVGTPNVVTSAVLMAPGATTHANDMSQKRIDLTVTPNQPGSSVNVSVPSNRNAVINGYYMLFLLDANGVPSVAHWIKIGERIGGGPSVPPAPTPTPTPPAPTPTPVPTATPTPTPAKPGTSDSGTGPSSGSTLTVKSFTATLPPPTTSSTKAPGTTLTLTRAQTKTATTKVLKRYKSFRAGKSRSYSIRRLSATRLTTTVRWKYRSRRYRTKVSVSLSTTRLTVKVGVR